jgi:hypothetical protein
VQAYEFSAVVENGVIPIPGHYLDKIFSPVKVIILSEELKTKEKNNKGKRFTAMKLKTKGFKFNREEANERW